jgi:Ca-activated chloride channel family protein
MDRPVNRRSFVLLATLVAGFSIPLTGQVFRGGTDVVMLSVTVVDSEGQLITGLEVEDFHVFEDGVLQAIENFSRDPQPIALSILVDTSASMDTKLGIAQRAATGFVRRLGPKDVAQIIDFDSRARIRQDFTNDTDALERAIRATAAGGPTALYEALQVALNQLRLTRSSQGDEIRRQAVVVLSDGEDTRSLIDYVEVIDLSKRSEVVVYAIGLRTQSLPRRGYSEAESALRTMSTETGGLAYFVDDVMELESIYAEIADELASQYTIGYVSSNTAKDGTWRAVTVSANRRGSTGRTRSGYYAPKARR